MLTKLRSQWGIATILTISIVLVITLVMVVDMALDIRRERAASRVSLEERGRLLASSLSDVLADNIYLSDMEALRDVAELMRSQPDVEYIRVFNREGRFLVTSPQEDGRNKYATGFASDQFSLQVLQDGKTRLRFKGDALEMASPITAGREVLGVVEFGFNADALRAEIRALILQHVWQGGLLVVIGIFLAYFIAQYFASPIRRLAVATTQVGMGESEFTANNDRNDEIGELSRSFSLMAGRIQERTSELEASNAQLTAEIEERQRLEDLERHRAQELAVADEVARIVTSTLNIDEVYEKFALEVKKLVEFDRMNINIIDREAGVFTIKYLAGEGLPGRHLGSTRPLPDSRTQDVIDTDRTLVRANFSEESRFPADLENVKLGLRSGILVPLISEGNFFGVLSLRSCRLSAYGPRDQAILERLANQIAPALENSRLYLRLQASMEEMQLVDEVAHIITSTLNIDEVYERFTQELKKLVDFDRSSINIIDPEAGTITLKYLFGPARPGRPLGSVEPLEGSHTQQIMQKGQPLVRADIASDQKFPREQEFLASGLNSSIGVQLISKGQPLGSLILRSRRVNAYGPRDQAILERLANQIAPALENSRLYLRLQERTAELTSASNAKTEFLSHMSHELRTPLNSTLGFAQLLQEPSFGSLNTRQDRFVKNIISSGRHLLGLINDVIDISKIEQGTIQLEVSLFDVRECLSDCRSMATGMAENKDINFKVSYPPVGTLISGDQIRIKQIVLNLLRNAFQFTPAGGEVLLESYVVGEDLIISVKDKGIGISEEHQRRLFDLFDAGPEGMAKRADGSGLGLPLVRELTEMHHGRVSLSSEESQGSCFTVTLPLSPLKISVSMAQKEGQE